MTSFTGRLLLPGSAGFEEAVIGRVFNARRPDRRPAAVLEAASEWDVVAGVRLARERGWKVAVRSGGHSWAAWSVRDEGLLIDLGRFKEIHYDPANQIVSVTPAVKGGDELNVLLEKHGRFFNGGHCPSVGLGGFLLQGGMGWNARGWGWAAENIVAIEVVTADGELVCADADTHTDLFWAARGAGPAFPGVVTRFHLRTLPLPGALSQTVHRYPIELYDEVMTWLYGIHGTISTDVEIVAVTQYLEGELALLVTGVALTGTPEQARAALAPLADCPLIDQAVFRLEAEPTTFGEQRAQQTAMNPEHHRYLVDNAWITGPAELAVPAMRTAFTGLPTEKTFTIFFSMAPLRDLPDLALSLQTEVYLATYVIYEDPALDESLRGWLNTAMAELEPVTAGQYLGDSDFTNRRLKVLGDTQEKRLEQIRADRDPTGLFVGHLYTR
jgi:FAD/FMN-containing dehydrogenase